MIGHELVLGVRLARLSGYTARARGTLLAATVAVVTFLTLCICAAPSVLSAQDERAAARTPTLSAPDRGKAPLKVSSARHNYSIGRWNGHEIRALYISGRKGATVPPGVDALPKSGTMYASPELARLVESDAVVGALFETYRIVGTVSDRGLISPNEAFAVVGVGADRWLQPAKGFGESEPLTRDTSTTARLNVVITILVVVLIALPAVLLTLISARMSGAERRSRAAALYLLGVSRRGIRVILALETLIVAVPSSVLGVLAFEVARANMSSIPGTDFGWYPSDVDLALGWRALAPLAVVAVTVAVAASASGPTTLRVRAPSGAARLRRWPLLVVTAGLVATTCAASLPGLAVPVRAVAFYAGVGLIAIGLPLAGPAIITSLASATAAYARSAATSLGYRIASGVPGTAVRMASVLAAVAVLTGFVAPFLAILTGTDARAAEQILSADRVNTIQVSPFNRALESTDMHEWTGVLSVKAATGKNEPVQAWQLRVEGDETKTVQARIAGLDPYASLATGRLQWVDPDNAQYTSQVQIIGVGCVLCVLLALLALAMGALGDARSRRSHVRGLKLLGGSRVDLLRTHSASICVPIAVLGMLGSLLALILSRLMLRLDERAFVSWQTYVAIAIGSVLVAIVVGAVTAPTVTSSLDPDEITTMA